MSDVANVEEIQPYCARCYGDGYSYCHCVGDPAPLEGAIAPQVTLTGEAYEAHVAFVDAARELKEATIAVAAAQDKYRAAVGRLSAAVAP